MQHHEVHKCIILAPQLWFMKQQVGRGGNKAGGTVNKAQLPFWNGPFLTFFCCSFGMCSMSFPAAPILLLWEVCELRLPGSVAASVWTSQQSVLQSSALAARVPRCWRCWEVR